MIGERPNRSRAAGRRGLAPAIVFAEPALDALTHRIGRQQGPGTSAPSPARDSAGFGHLELTPFIMDSPLFPKGKALPPASAAYLLCSRRLQTSTQEPQARTRQPGFKFPGGYFQSWRWVSQLHNLSGPGPDNALNSQGCCEDKKRKARQECGISPCSEQGGCYFCVFMVTVPRISP